MASVDESGNISIKDTVSEESVATIIAKYRLNPQEKQVIHINVVNDIQKDISTIINKSSNMPVLTEKVVEKKMTNSMEVTTIAGSTEGFADGVGVNAKFDAPIGLVIDDGGNIYVTDINNHKIRKITSDGIVSTFAGSSQGLTDSKKFSFPTGILMDNLGDFFICSTSNNEIVKLGNDGIFKGSIGTGESGDFLDGSGNYEAKFSNPRGLAIDKQGNIFVADTLNNKIRKISLEGNVSTFVVDKEEQGFINTNKSNNNGYGHNFPSFKYPESILVDKNDNIFIADTGNNKIVKITPDNVVSTFAGNKQGFADGVGVNAKFDAPIGLVIDDIGNIYVADSNNHKIRKITPDGVVSTFAGSTYGYKDGVGNNAKFYYPKGLAIDNDGSIYDLLWF